MTAGHTATPGHRWSGEAGASASPIGLSGALEAVARCRWADAEPELLALLAGDQLSTPDAQATALAAMARVQLWAHNDAATALATLSPALSLVAAGRLSGATRVDVHAAAAQVFSEAHGGVFDAGKVGRYVQLVEQADPEDLAEVRFDARGAAAVAELATALYLGDPALIRRAVERGAAREAVSVPVLSAQVAELRGHLATVEGRPGDAAQRFAEAAALACALGAPLMQARALAFCALHRLLALDDPARVLEMTGEAERLASRQPHRRGIPELIAGRAHGEALTRLGRFSEAEQVLSAAESVAEEIAWPPIMIVQALARVYAYSGNSAALAGLGERLETSGDRWSGAG